MRATKVRTCREALRDLKRVGVDVRIGSKHWVVYVPKRFVSRIGWERLNVRLHSKADAPLPVSQLIELMESEAK